MLKIGGPTNEKITVKQIDPFDPPVATSMFSLRLDFVCRLLSMALDTVPRSVYYSPSIVGRSGYSDGG